MSKLLTEQELKEKLETFKGVTVTDITVDSLLSLIVSQKRAHADMVIGEDESSDTKTEKDAVIRSGGINMSFGQIKTVDIRADGRNQLRTEQRERNAS